MRIVTQTTEFGTSFRAKTIELMKLVLNKMHAESEKFEITAALKL